MFFPNEVSFQVLEHLDLVAKHLLLVVAVHVLLAYELFELGLADAFDPELADVGLTQIDDLLFECWNEHFKVGVLSSADDSN